MTLTRDRWHTLAGLSLKASRSELVDAAFLTATVVLGLVGFRSAFGDDVYLVGGVIGLVAGILIAHLSGRLRMPTLAAGTISVVAFFALGGAAALRSTALLGFIPTGTTVTSLVRGSINGWVELLTRLPPVGSRSPLVAIPYLLGLTAGVTGYLLARRTRSPLLPAVAPLVVLTLGILFGTTAPVSTIAQGAVFGCLVLAWGAVRQDRRSAATLGTTRHARRLLVGGAMLVASGAAAVAIAPYLPLSGSEKRVVMRSYVQPPFDAAAFPSPLGGFRKYVAPKGLRDRTLFVIKGLPAGTRVGLATMDVYDGLAWGVGNGSNGSFFQIGTRIPASAKGRTVTAHISIAAYSDVWLPIAGEPTAIRFDGTGEDQLAAGLRFDLATTTGVVPQGLRAGETYTITTVIPSPASARALAGATPGGTPGGITNPPPLATTRVGQWSGHTSASYAALATLARHLESGSYSDGGKNNSESQPGHGEYRLQQFLAQPELVGDDEQYSATFALMASAMGYPVRVVLGAIPEASGVVKGRDIHAWPEVELSGAGWVPFDVTPPRSHRPNPKPPPEVEVNRVPSHVPPATQQAHPAPETGADSTVNASSHKQTTHATSHGGTALALVVLVTAGRYGGPPIAAIAAVLAVIVALKALRRAARRRRGSPAERMSAGWRELVDLAVDMGAPRPPLGTRRMTVQALDVPELVTLANHADRASFGPSAPDAAEAQTYWASIGEARRRLLGTAGLRRRMAARFSIASFRRRPGRPVATESTSISAGS